VIYDHNSKNGSITSAYMALMLIYSGLDDVKILDGGYMAWVFQNQILVTRQVVDKKYGTVDVNLRTKLFVDTSYVKKNLQNIKILDARASDEYFGITKSKNIEKFGHIPYASSSSYRVKFLKDLTLRPQNELTQIYKKGHNLKIDDEVIVYSKSIIDASMEWYILYQHMGYKNAKIYTNSLMGWLNHEYNLIRFKWE